MRERLTLLCSGAYIFPSARYVVEDSQWLVTSDVCHLHAPWYYFSKAVIRLTECEG